MSNFVVNNLTAQFIDKKFDRVLDKLKIAVKFNLALGFILKNIEDAKFKYFYAHEINTLLEQSKFLSNKDDMSKIERGFEENRRYWVMPKRKVQYEVEIF